jgi:hypothetical protein
MNDQDSYRRYHQDNQINNNMTILDSNTDESSFIKLPVKKPLLQYSRTKDTEIENERKVV